MFRTSPQRGGIAVQSPLGAVLASDLATSQIPVAPASESPKVVILRALGCHGWTGVSGSRSWGLGHRSMLNGGGELPGGASPRADHGQEHLETCRRVYGMWDIGREPDEVTGLNPMGLALDSDLGFSSVDLQERVEGCGMFAQPLAGVEREGGDGARGILVDCVAHDGAVLVGHELVQPDWLGR